MKIFFKILGWVAFALLSVGYFLWIYNETGFSLTARCFFTYGFCLAAYVTCSYLGYLVLEEGV